MAAATATSPQLRSALDENRRSEPRMVTLLELIAAVSASTDDDREVVATILSMLNRGRVKLCGNFRNEPIEDFND